MQKNKKTTVPGVRKYKKGFTIFLAVLVSSLALAIGIAIFDLVVRELQLSSTTEQSQYAIYAADSGVECALYWDSHYSGTRSIFATSSSDTVALTATNAYCSGVDITSGRTISTTPTSAVSTSTLTIGTKYFAQVVVLKTKNVSTGAIQTTIYSHGFNDTNITAPTTVERELQINY